MTTIGTDATSWSVERRTLAETLAASCPPQLGQAIIVTGSVARGVADRYSPVELRFLVDEIQPFPVYQDWLRSLGGLVELADDAERLTGAAIKSWHDGVLVGAFWQPWSALEATLDMILQAETDDHWTLTEAWRIAAALPARAHERLTALQGRLQEYPDALRDRLIGETTATWTTLPWWPASLVTIWPLVTRDARLALLERLTRYLQRGLRITFALNRCWEPDYTWLASEARRLTVKPGELVSRVNSALTLEHPRESVRMCLALLIDILTLASEEYDVSAARERVKEALDDNHLPPARGVAQASS
jgi:hypothetical protein